MSDAPRPPSRRPKPTDALAEKVAKRVLELLRERARTESERRGKITRRNP